jgi:glycosyltransferase involved in cell wall biosynthesis
MSREVPVAVFHHGAFEDFIRDGESGFVFETGNIDFLTGKLIDIEPDKGLLKKIGSRGQALVSERLNRRLQAEELIKLINK